MPKRRKRFNVAVDWDSTLVEGRWPDMGEWLPDAVWAMREFLSEGYRVMVFSARLSPYGIDGSLRDPADVQKSIDEVREKLDRAGLVSVLIWTKPGKPPYDVLIDDKAERYPGTRRAWRAMVTKVKLRFGAEEPFYDDVDWESVPEPAY